MKIVISIDNADKKISEINNIINILKSLENIIEIGGNYNNNHIQIDFKVDDMI